MSDMDQERLFRLGDKVRARRGAAAYHKGDVATVRGIAHHGLVLIILLDGHDSPSVVRAADWEHVTPAADPPQATAPRQSFGLGMATAGQIGFNKSREKKRR